jgi:hypothetical protein
VATVFISEFKNAMSPIGTYAAPVLPQPALANTGLGFTGAGTLSGAFGPNTYAVLICGDTDCFFKFGATSATGATGAGVGMYLPAKVPMIFAVAPGDKVAVTA